MAFASTSIAVCCSVLQCVAVCCSALQCVAVFGCVLQCVSSVLQSDAVGALLSFSITIARCNTLQHTAAVYCNTLQHVAIHCNALNTLQHTARHCNTHFNTLQHRTAAKISVNSSDWAFSNYLFHSATHCNTMQHTATHRNTERLPKLA